MKKIVVGNGSAAQHRRHARARAKASRSRASPFRPGAAPSRRRSARPGSIWSRRSSASPSRRTRPPASPISAPRSPPAARPGICRRRARTPAASSRRKASSRSSIAAIVNDAGVPKDLKTDYWISQIVYSIAIGWRTKAFGDKKPEGWAAFWDTEGLPGPALHAPPPDLQSRGGADRRRRADGQALSASTSIARSRSSRS